MCVRLDGILLFKEAITSSERADFALCVKRNHQNDLFIFNINKLLQHRRWNQMQCKISRCWEIQNDALESPKQTKNSNKLWTTLS